MVTIKICIGSSCFLKGASKIIEFINNKISENNLYDKIELKGNLCAGNCNRIGVTIHIDNKAFIGVKLEEMEEFWNKNIVPILM